MRKLDLEYYRQPLDWLDPDAGALLVKSAVACLVDENHSSGVAMQTTLDAANQVFELNWQSRIDEQQLFSLPNDHELTQKGAEYVSLLQAKSLLGYDAFVTSRIGTRVDYWLKYSDSLNLEARLEVSGIRKETKGNLASTRLKHKTKQVEKSSENDFPTYISIIEFSGPKSIFVSQP